MLTLWWKGAKIANPKPNIWLKQIKAEKIRLKAIYSRKYIKCGCFFFFDNFCLENYCFFVENLQQQQKNAKIELVVLSVQSKMQMTKVNKQFYSLCSFGNHLSRYPNFRVVTSFLSKKKFYELCPRDKIRLKWLLW